MRFCFILFQMLETFTASMGDDQCAGAKHPANVDKNRFQKCVPSRSNLIKWCMKFDTVYPICFLFHFYLATSTTNWAQVFTGMIYPTLYISLFRLQGYVLSSDTLGAFTQSTRKLSNQPRGQASLSRIRSQIQSFGRGY